MAFALGLDMWTSDERRGLTVMGRRFIPVAAPILVGNEKAYVMDCLDSTWISSNGKYIQLFEDAFADFCGVKHAISCCNGTVALHLALMALGAGPGDEVIVPSLTYVATANAVTYCGAKPVFVDSDPETWNIDPELVEAQITPRTKAIIVVHLYGHPANMATLLTVARRHGLSVIEDAAEAHGAEYRGQKVGSIGDIGTFSFYGNKIITTGEGGMVVTSHDHLADKLRLLNGQGMDPSRRYWFSIIGYNYRMTNIAAAIGLAQLEKAEWYLQQRAEIARWYQEELQGIAGLTWQPAKEWAKHVYWMFTVLLDDDLSVSRDQIMAYLAERGAETRPVFHPIHTLPPYRCSILADRLPVAERISRRGMNLPTWAGLHREEVRYVRECLSESVTKAKLLGQVGRRRL